MAIPLFLTHIDNILGHNPTLWDWFRKKLLLAALGTSTNRWWAGMSVVKGRTALKKRRASLGGPKPREQRQGFVERSIGVLRCQGNKNERDRSCRSLETALLCFGAGCHGWGCQVAGSEMKKLCSLQAFILRVATTTHIL